LGTRFIKADLTVAVVICMLKTHTVAVFLKPPLSTPQLLLAEKTVRVRIYGSKPVTRIKVSIVITLGLPY
jgi:hypothetical protein